MEKVVVAVGQPNPTHFDMHYKLTICFDPLSGPLTRHFPTSVKSHKGDIVACGL